MALAGLKAVPYQLGTCLAFLLKSHSLGTSVRAQGHQTVTRFPNMNSAITTTGTVTGFGNANNGGAGAGSLTTGGPVTNGTLVMGRQTRRRALTKRGQ